MKKLISLACIGALATLPLIAAAQGSDDEAGQLGLESPYTPLCLVVDCCNTGEESDAADILERPSIPACIPFFAAEPSQATTERAYQ